MLKTSILGDLVVSLATATPFLGRFHVPEAVRVMFMSAESGHFTLQETLNRVCAARGISLADANRNLLLQFDLPRFGSAEDLAELAAGLRDDAVDAVVFDPAYLAMLAGQGPGGARAENLFEMGPLLRSVTQTCLAVGATPAFVFHAKKGTAASLEPADLDDLAYAGVAEFSRQWLLLSRRQRYEPGTGQHRLWMSVGGSMGHGGSWSVDVDEGVIDAEFRGRRWGVSVHTGVEARQSAREECERAKTEEQRAQDRADQTAVVAALDKLDPSRQGASWNQVQGLASLSDARMLRAVQRLKEQGTVEERPVAATIGSGAQRQVKGLRRKPERGGTDHFPAISGKWSGEMVNACQPSISRPPPLIGGPGKWLVGGHDGAGRTVAAAGGEMVGRGMVLVRVS
jgi:replicative DNA helicase